jgi:DNA-binding transcriptional ArsR family regulator
LDLEDVLSSSCRRKIIKYLVENGSTNVMQLILGIRGKYPQTNSELITLKKEGIVLDEHIGRMRNIRLNKENPKTLLLLKALKILNEK